MINLGAFIAPIATGALGAAFGWHVGFAFAGFGMLLGLVIFMAGQGALTPHAPRAARGQKVRLTAPERAVVWRLIALVPVAALFWIAQSQVWNTYNLWVRDHIELQVGAFTVPVPWLQALDGLAPFVCLPPMLLFWRWQASRGKEPGEFVKIAIGCFIFAASTLWLGGAGLVTDGHGRTPLMWAVAFHFASNLGWLYFTPTILALFSRAAPRSVAATMIGILQLVGLPRQHDQRPSGLALRDPARQPVLGAAWGPGRPGRRDHAGDRPALLQRLSRRPGAGGRTGHGPLGRRIQPRTQSRQRQPVARLGTEACEGLLGGRRRLGRNDLAVLHVDHPVGQPRDLARRRG